MTTNQQIALFFGTFWGSALCTWLWIRWAMKRDANAEAEFACRVQPVAPKSDSIGLVRLGGENERTVMDNGQLMALLALIGVGIAAGMWIGYEAWGRHYNHWRTEAKHFAALSFKQEDELMRTWFVLKEFGLHPGRTDDTLSECVRRALKPNVGGNRLAPTKE